MHFNTFSDDCILHIFDRLPLQTLLSYDLEIVCRKWRSFVQIACRQRKSLLLLVGEGALEYIPNYCLFANPSANVILGQGDTALFVSNSDVAKWHGLKCEELSMKTCLWLVKKLPNVASLEISIRFRAHTMINAMITLMAGWSSKLVTLKLWLGNTSDDEELLDDIEPEEQQEIAQNYWLLMGGLNFLAALKNLILYTCVYLLGPEQMQRKSGQIDLPILSQLHKFYFSSLDPADVILDSLVRYGEPNENLRQIGLCDNVVTQECVDKFFELSPDLRSRFIHIFPRTDPNAIITSKYANLDADLNKICYKFSSQTNLYCILKNDISYSKTIQTLTSLKQLSILSLVHIAEINQFYFANENIQFDSIAQLPTVKMLHLELYFTSHTVLDQMNIDWVFPNLQAIQILLRSQKCTECGYEKRKSTSDLNEEKYKQCMALLVKPLQKCTALRSTKMGYYVDQNGDFFDNI